MMDLPRAARRMGCLGFVILLAACSNGSGSLEEPQQPPSAGAQATTYSIGGTVTGLTGGGLVLQNNGGGNLTIAADGAFTFATPAAAGNAYAVTVLTQPASQTCTVANGTGTIAAANIANVTVTCAATSGPRFSVGGGITGLTGSGLVLQNNQGDDLPILTNGSFTFPTPLSNGATYSVGVRAQPAGQNCVVSGASGTIANANVTNVAVSCAANMFTVGVNVSGLAGTGLRLTLNGGSALTVNQNGQFAFSTALAPSTAYDVRVATNPSNPTQVCSPASTTGTIVGENVSIPITCVTSSFTISGSVNGLAGSGLRLQLNGTTELAIASNGSFSFPTPLLSGTTYAVRVIGQPTNLPQVCTVARGEGTVRDADIRNIGVACATQTFPVGGSVSGLLGSGLTLVNNGGDPIAIGADGRFVFPRHIASGSTYAVTVQRHPADPTQACTVANGTGTIGISEVVDVAVSCSTSNFTVGGTVESLVGGGLILRNNGGDDLSVTASGPFAFATAIPSGASYAVTIGQQPIGQNCSVQGNSGTGAVRDRNVDNVRIRCGTAGFTITANVSGLQGSGLVLQNNGGDDLAIASNGRHTFFNAVLFGASYNVTVLTQPAAPAQICTVTNASGTVFFGSVDNVAVTCTP